MFKRSLKYIVIVAALSLPLGLLSWQAKAQPFSLPSV